MKTSASLLLGILLMGCTQPAPESDGPARVVRTATTTATATVTVTPTVTATPTATATPEAGVHRVRVEYSGAPEVSVSVQLNNVLVGTYTGSAEGDLSASTQPGINQVQLDWKVLKPLSQAQAVRVVVERKTGEDQWSAVYTRDFTNKTKERQSSGSFSAGDISPTPLDSSATPSVSEAPLDTTATPLPVAAVAGPRYVLKVEMNMATHVVFDASLNGNPLGSFSGSSQRDITSEIQPGKNTLVVSYRHTAKGNAYHKSVFTLGANQDNRWDTVAKVHVAGNTPDGKETVTFNGPRAAP